VKGADAAYGRTGILVDQFSYTPVFIQIAFISLAGTEAFFALGWGYWDLGIHASS